MTWAIAAWVLRALAAALLVVEHVALAVRARRRPEGAGAVLAALLVPGLGAMWAWRDGARFAPVRYGVFAAAYLALAVAA